MATESLSKCINLHGFCGIYLLDTPGQAGVIQIPLTWNLGIRGELKGYQSPDPHLRLRFLLVSTETPEGFA